jgi:hypothetical protein
VFHKSRNIIRDLQPAFRGVPRPVQKDVTQPKPVRRRELQLGPLDRSPDPKKVVDDPDGGSQVRVILERRTRTERECAGPEAC